jgi:hypothetical protein
MRCSICKFWYKLTGFEGECKTISKERSESIRAVTVNTVTKEAIVVITAANFGCVLHEKKGKDEQ